MHRDPQFTREDVALMIASRRLERDMGSHGISMSEAMDPANQFAFDAQEAPRIDWAEKKLRDNMDRFYEARPKGESRNGHKWGRVTKRE